MNNHKDLDVWKKSVSSKKAKLKSQSKAVIAQGRDRRSRQSNALLLRDDNEKSSLRAVDSQTAWQPSLRAH